MLRHLVSKLLDKKLPLKTKRQIFLASFAALVKGTAAYDKETFGKLNQVLVLSESGESALAVPALLSKVIWNGKTSYEVCKEDVREGSFTADRISRIVTNVLSNMPKCLLYGTIEEIGQDVATLLKERDLLLGT